MAHYLEIQNINDTRGNLSIIEDQLGFSIARVFYIHQVPKEAVRGEHAHKKTQMALISVSGDCEIEVHKKGNEITNFKLDCPTKCLYIDPSDWHLMKNFSSDCVLLVLASEKYDKEDYIFERPI
ncbi:FdtA/QdtA family cupin domain-containing protein [Halobacteriovorax sp. HLS]|uniref:sugar 3,4-ketoisomerase n=1 Tax=Halobacteriovorax sp. HLS TaxID=2234000 RepID=UPI000FDCCF22|nr:FdtA/QdtA family cupin domain-containing protein [Halobacteriovorax sp. HLS]